MLHRLHSMAMTGRLGAAQQVYAPENPTLTSGGSSAMHRKWRGAWEPALAEAGEPLVVGSWAARPLVRKACATALPTRPERGPPLATPLFVISPAHLAPPFTDLPSFPLPATAAATLPEAGGWPSAADTAWWWEQLAPGIGIALPGASGLGRVLEGSPKAGVVLLPAHARTKGKPKRKVERKGQGHGQGKGQHPGAIHLTAQAGPARTAGSAACPSAGPARSAAAAAAPAKGAGPAVARTMCEGRAGTADAAAAAGSDISKGRARRIPGPIGALMTAVVFFIIRLPASA